MIISEFLPNPVGKDTDGEWIKLFNDFGSAVDLSGWQIKDASGKAFIFSPIGGKNNIIASGETLALDYKTTKISLNNNGEIILLYNKDGNLVDRAEYKGSAPDGKSYVRAENGKFILSGAWANGQSANFTQNFPTQIEQSASAGVIINNSNIALNFLTGIFIALVLAGLFIFISQKLDLFPEEK